MNKLEVGNKVGVQAELTKTNQKGITLLISKISTENWKEKYSFSFDDDVKIERISIEDVKLNEEVPKTIFFERLLRDIQSKEDQTRIYASEILCDFLEFDIEDFDLPTLKSGLDKSIDQLKVESNFDVEQKLAEGLFEFIYSNKMTKDEKREFLIKLTSTNSLQVCNYLEDDEFLAIPEVVEYVNRIRDENPVDNK